jgi:ATP-dependent DNA ligase
VVLCAFDLIELEGEDSRRKPIEDRKHKLSRLVRTPRPGIVVNEHYDGDGETVFKYACKLGCEGIVSKRLGSHYRSGRSPHWVKVKNPRAPRGHARGGRELGAMRSIFQAPSTRGGFWPMLGGSPSFSA